MPKHYSFPVGPPEMRARRNAGAILLAAALAACSTSMPREAAPLRVSGHNTVLEMGPMLTAAKHSPAGSIIISDGNVRSLWETSVPSSPTPAMRTSGADLAGNSETQGLLASLDHPDLRIIMTITEGLYYILARRSAGIATASDLKGKRIATYANSSAAFYLDRVLRRNGISNADVTIVPLRIPEFADALVSGRVDAISMWQPEVERARAALGADAVELRDPRAYRELYSLYATAASLADPEKRRQIVSYVRRLITACAEATSDPGETQALLSEMTAYDVELIAASWPEHRFPCGLPDDMIEIMVAEEQWLAEMAGRPARDRDELVALVDSSILEEAGNSR